MKINILRTILVILLISTFGIIFNFSGQDGEQSGGLSRKVLQKVVDIFTATKNLSLEEKQQIIENGQPIVRKLAHFSIYALVGFLIMGLMSTYNIQFIKQLIASILLGFIYACTDEFHQSFIPGRSAEIRDVCIDTFGVIFGIIVIILILNVHKKITDKNLVK